MTKKAILEEILTRIDCIEFTMDAIDKRTRELEKVLKPKKPATKAKK